MCRRTWCLCALFGRCSYQCAHKEIMISKPSTPNSYTYLFACSFGQSLREKGNAIPMDIILGALRIDLSWRLWFVGTHKCTLYHTAMIWFFFLLLNVAGGMLLSEISSVQKNHLSKMQQWFAAGTNLLNTAGWQWHDLSLVWVIYLCIKQILFALQL